MKNIKYFFSLLIFSALVISSCSKENIDDTNTNPGKLNPPTNQTANPIFSRMTSDLNTEGLEFDCITILYPFSLTDVEGNNFEINSDDEFNQFFLEDSIVIIDFVYPLTVEKENGDQVQVENGEELGTLFSECTPGGGWTEDQFPAFLISFENSCYNLSYPLTLTNSEGEIFTASSEDEFVELLVEEPMFFVFSLSLIDEDGNIINVETVDELFDALISCNGWENEDSIDWGWNDGFENIGCYSLIFPFDIVLSDGTVVTVVDHMQYCDYLLQGNILDFSYPISLLDAEGNIVTVSSQDDLFSLLEDCDYPIVEEVTDFQILLLGTYPNDSTSVGCYSINYPVSLDVVDFEGNIKVVEELVISLTQLIISS
ncbi:MAG TPA: hypothetical protein P5235_05235, partial [Saprospiraceae bacterium]|nr:hypothetical protein [Saprospiraceae bacterium]